MLTKKEKLLNDVNKICDDCIVDDFKTCKQCRVRKILQLISSAPTVDTQDVIRCGDCVHGKKCYGPGGSCVVCEYSNYLKDPSGFCDEANNKDGMHTTTYVPLIHAEWIESTGMQPPEYFGRHICSRCYCFAPCDHRGIEDFTPYCPNCMARMDGRK